MRSLVAGRAMGSTTSEAVDGTLQRAADGGKDAGRVVCVFALNENEGEARGRT